MKAYEILEKYGWYQGARAKDANGEPCSAKDPRAAVFTAWGAIIRAYGDEASEKVARLAEYLFPDHHTWLNTEPFKKSAERLKLDEKRQIESLQQFLITMWNNDQDMTSSKVISTLKELDI